MVLREKPGDDHPDELNGVMHCSVCGGDITSAETPLMKRVLVAFGEEAHDDLGRKKSGENGNTLSIGRGSNTQPTRK